MESPSKICEICRNEFVRRATETKSVFSRRKCCSRTCSGKWRSLNVKRASGPDSPLYQKPRPKSVVDKMKATMFKKGEKPWNADQKGLQTHSQSTRDKMSQAHLGREKSEQHKENISKSKIGPKNPQFGKPAPNRGQHPSESAREKISEARLYQITPSSKLEQMLHQDLHRRGIEFQEGIPIFGHPDIFILPNICIFVDGEYDHADPKKYKPDDIIRVTKIAKQIWAYDKDVTESLEEMGMIVLRFWGNDIKKDPAACVDVIVSHIKSVKFQAIVY